MSQLLRINYYIDYFELITRGLFYILSFVTRNMANTCLLDFRKGYINQMTDDVRAKERHEEAQTFALPLYFRVSWFLLSSSSYSSLRRCKNCTVNGLGE